MNRALRQRHLLTVTVLAPVAAATLVTAVAARRHAPPNQVPSLLVGAPSPTGKELSRTIIRGDGLTLEVRRLSTDRGSTLELRPLARTIAADVLVYLGHSGSAGLTAASLLGSLGGPEPVRFALPGDSAVGSVLLFYSPAVGRLLARDSVSLAR